MVTTQFTRESVIENKSKINNIDYNALALMYFFAVVLTGILTILYMNYKDIILTTKMYIVHII